VEGEAEVTADIHSQLIDLLVQLPPLGLNDCHSVCFAGLAFSKSWSRAEATMAASTDILCSRDT
jgi:hypothetical protein